MKKLLPWLLCLLMAWGPANAATFNVYTPAAGIQKNTGNTWIDTPAVASDVAATYIGQSGCTGAAALLFNATCQLLGTGTVTSVSVTVPSPLTPTGCSGTTILTCAITWTGGQTANQFLATPNGSTGAVGLRAIVAADIPTLNQNTSGQSGTALALAANPTDCAASRYAVAIDAGANLTCGQVAYTDLSGTPTIPTLPTFQTNATPLTSASTINFQNSAAFNGVTFSFSNPSAGNIQLGASGTFSNAALTNSSTTVNGQTCTLGSTCTVPIQTNGGGNTSQAGLNFITSTTNSVGLTATPSNPGTNQEKWEITGSSYSGNAATASALAANPTDCGANQYATTIDAGGNLTCAQVAYTQITGTPTVPVSTTGSFTGTFTGMTVAITNTCIYSIEGNQVTLLIGVATGNSNAATFTMTGLPAPIQPTHAHIFTVPYNATENGGGVTGAVVSATIAASSGTVTFLGTGSTSGWVSSGVKGVVSAFPITYLLN